MSARAHHALLMAAGGGGFVDDYVTPYGVWSAEKKLIRAYSGPAIRVRRSSDNAEQDIAFAGGVLDTATLLTFTGANSGYVTKIYQQVAALTGADLVQATAAAQPRIVNAGTLEADYVQYDGSNDFMTAALPTGGMASAAATLFTRVRIDSAVGGSTVAGVMDVGHNTGSTPGFGMERDNRSIITGTPGVTVDMSGGSSGPYIQRAFPDSTLAPSGATHVFTARFDLSVTATDDAAVHAFMDGSDAGVTTRVTGDPSGTFAYTVVRTGKGISSAYTKIGLHSLVLVASDALSARANIEALL